MKKLVLSAFALFAVLNLQSQNFQGMAVYESKTSTADFRSRFEGNRDMTPEMQKMIEERMKKMFEKTFILNFDKAASIYKEEEKLDAPGQNQGNMRMMASVMGGGGSYYKDIKNGTYTVDREFMGKEFLIKDSLPKLKWMMEGESRQIGGYNCFKATAVVPVNKSDFRNYRPKKRDGEAEAKKDESTRSTNWMDEVEMPKETTITAWYTPEIPVSQGPEQYWGLPGLILEVNDGKTVILCSKIILNPKDKVQIKAPSGGKVVNQKEYDEIVVKKTEEMQQMYRNQSPGGGRNTMRIGG
jgi:GLPGLI family protein